MNNSSSNNRRSYADLVEENGSLKRRHVELLDELIRLRKQLDRQSRYDDTAAAAPISFPSSASSVSSSSSSSPSSFCPETEEWRDLSLRLMHIIISSGKFH